jgi:hypothetical protein
MLTVSTLPSEEPEPPIEKPEVVAVDTRREGDD